VHYEVQSIGYLKLEWQLVELWLPQTGMAALGWKSLLSGHLVLDINIVFNLYSELTTPNTKITSWLQ